MVFLRFSYGCPRVFLWSSYEFPMIFVWWVYYGFLWLSYGIPIVFWFPRAFLSFSDGTHSIGGERGHKGFEPISTERAGC